MSLEERTGPAKPTPQHGIRIYELARRLGIPSSDVLRRARAIDIEVNTVLQNLDRDGVGRVLNDYQHPTTEANGAIPDPDLVSELMSDLGATATTELPRPEPVENGDEPELDNETEPENEPEPETTLFVDPAEDDDLDDEDLESEPGPVDDFTSHLPQPMVEPGPEAASTELEPIPDPRRVPAGVVSRTKIKDWYDTFGSSVGLTDHGRRIVRVAVAIVAGTALLATVLAAIRPLHAAESEVVVTIAGSGDAERDLQSFNVVASSQSVLAPVAEELEISLSDLRDSFSSEIVGDSAVLRFLVTDRDPEQARVVNDAIVASYLSIANQPVDQAQVDFLDSEISDVRQSLEDTADRLDTLSAAGATDQATRLRIETDQAIAQSRLTNLESRLVDLRSGGETASGAISFVEGQINETRALLDALVAELQTLASAEAVVAQAEAERLRDERDALREQLGQLEARKVELELDQVGGPRARVLAPAHILDEPAGLTPLRALALGILVGSVIAFAWVVVATQLRRRHV